MTPGTYLRKRREAAGLDLHQVAATLAVLPWAVRPASTEDVVLLEKRLILAECGTHDLTPEQALLLRSVFRFDAEVYERLFLCHHAGRANGLPRPDVCRGCGCSWHDACEDAGVGCHWSAADPTLCSACTDRPAASLEIDSVLTAQAADWPDAPLPEGIPT
jgi:hypothetical protein